MKPNNPNDIPEEDVEEMRAEFERNSILDAEEEKTYKAEKSQENKKPEYLAELITKIAISGNKANKIIRDINDGRQTVWPQEGDSNDI